MAKPQFQDIVPPDRRSIKKIPLPTRSPSQPPSRVDQSEFFRKAPRQTRHEIYEEVYERPQEFTAHPDVEEEYEQPLPPPPPPRRRVREEYAEPEAEPVEYSRPRYKEPKPRRRFPWIVLIILIIAILAIAGTLLYMSRTSGAKVVVDQRLQQVSVDSTFNAVKSSTSTVSGAIEFQTVTISKDGKLEVAANGQEQATIKASGTIVIYNDFGTAPQKLVANTRFETPEGLIFRIADPVTIPGKTGTTPGSVEAIVTADKAGAEYNVGLKDFTIPGFKGDPKYQKIYARAKLPIQGGFSGSRPKVDPAEVTTAEGKIKDELKGALVGQAESVVPAGYVMPANAYFIEYESLPQTQTPSGGAQVAVRATFHGIILKSSDLATQLSQKANGTIDPSQTDLLGVANLMFTAKSGTNIKLWEATSLSFNLKGTTSLLSTIDTVSIQNELAGKPRKSLNAILAGYPSVSKADVTMWPFWRRSFPSDPAEITIVPVKPELSP